MTTADVGRPNVAERKAAGRAGRHAAPRSSHARWEPVADRPDPVGLLAEQNISREPDLVPIRHGRMLVSPFTFFRGAARIMASDLAASPRAGLVVQLCGDAHLSNFGAFASPERALLFDINDFDETLPGPFEYDVKRLATSFVVAARNNGCDSAAEREAALASVRAYREGMAKFAELRTLEIWYSRLDVEQLLTEVRQAGTKRATREAKRAKRIVRKARTRDSLQALSKLGELVDGRNRIVSQPPIVVPLRDTIEAYGFTADVARELVQSQLRDYQATLPDDRRHLLEQYEVVDVARKVVGVGSVGMRAYIVLLEGRDERDPLFLQLKEATTSVLADHLPASRYGHAGERVVRGQRLMQAASDIFLGWTSGFDVAQGFYWRQLRDMKMSVDVESMDPSALAAYGRLCGWTLARAHARSGDPIALAAYLGKGDCFDRASRRFRAGIRGSERARFRGVPRCRQRGPDRGHRGSLTLLLRAGGRSGQ